MGWPVLAVALLSWPVLAHDFWLQPSPFWTSPNNAVSMVLLVGHGAARQRSMTPLHRISLFRSVGPIRAVDRRASLNSNKAGPVASFAFADVGTHVVFFSTTSVPSELPALRFNEYAQSEGLTLVTRRRLRAGAMNNSGRELYSRRGKSLVQVGQPDSRTQSHVTSPVGLGLEIVPLRNPYQISSEPTLPIQVLYQGKPLAGALVKLNNLAADTQPVEVRRTNAEGMAVFQARRRGDWQFNVVWSQPLSNNRSADFLTTFSSLTFGFSKARGTR